MITIGDTQGRFNSNGWERTTPGGMRDRLMKADHEAIARIEHAELLAELREVNWHVLSVDQLQRILAIVREPRLSGHQDGR